MKSPDTKNVRDPSQHKRPKSDHKGRPDDITGGPSALAVKVNTQPSKPPDNGSKASISKQHNLALMGLDLAMRNAPKRVFHLIGDPRSGLADDVTSGTMGEITVDMVHHQLSNEVFWYKYEFDGNSAAAQDSHRDARLSEHAKNLLYIMRAKDPSKWTIQALSRKFRIRRQRVMAILALREMEAHKMEAGELLSGPLSAYACPVDLSDVIIEGKSGELVETAATSFTPKTAFIMKKDESHNIENQEARLNQVKQRVQSELIKTLSTLAYSLDGLTSDVSAQLSQIETELNRSIPLGEDPATPGGSEPVPNEPSDPSSSVANDISTRWLAIKGLQVKIASLSQKILLLDDDTSPLHFEQQLTKASSALLNELSTPVPSFESLSAAVKGWEGEKLLKLVSSIPLIQRKKLLETLQSLSSELVNQGADITTLLNSEQYLPPPPSPSPSPSSTSPSSLSRDALGSRPVPEALLTDVVSVMRGLEEHITALQGLVAIKENKGKNEPPAAATSNKGMTSKDLSDLLHLRGAYLSCNSMISSLEAQASDLRGEGKSPMQRVVSQVLHEAGPAPPSRVKQYQEVVSMLQGATHPLPPELESLALMALEQLEGSETKARSVLRSLVPQECTPNPPLDPDVQLGPGEATSAPRSPDDVDHKGSWELISAHIDARVASKVFHRGSGEKSDY